MKIIENMLHALQLVERRHVTRLSDSSFRRGSRHRSCSRFPVRVCHTQISKHDRCARGRTERKHSLTVKGTNKKVEQEKVDYDSCAIQIPYKGICSHIPERTAEIRGACRVHNTCENASSTAGLHQSQYALRVQFRPQGQHTCRA